MGKSGDRHLPLHHRQLPNGSGPDGGSSYLSRFFPLFNFKCFFVLLLGVAVFLSAVFWVLPHHSNHRSGFDHYDAKDSTKLSSSVQASFQLDKAVSDITPYIDRLEYNIFGEIGVPFTKVAVLHVHPAAVLSNHTNVTFGVLSDPVDIPINSVSLNLLRSSLLDVFLQQANLILTTSVFGLSSSFQILKFPGGMTLNPDSNYPLWQEQILFRFKLNNSIGEIKEYFVEFKEQLRSGLRLRQCENVFVQVNNKKGSTVDPPVTIEASIVSDRGHLTWDRLRELATIITGSSHARNLGLDNSVFGKVKEISLSSLLNHSLQALLPAPSPSPLQNHPKGPSSPSNAHRPYAHTPLPSQHRHRSRSQEISPAHSPVSHGFSNGGHHQNKGNPTSFAPAPAPSISSSDPSCERGCIHAGMYFINVLGSLILCAYWI
ncbi:unnamed protein product [Cuscuta europaea]|uniref:DUF7036 domain-containing protein n=1 Tax=Cuscuta europaea TaxID=41803 RepID=A0A9P0Z0C7_CUSEU|nr:unnamed protein product [Cuscuta europaea]